MRPIPTKPVLPTPMHEKNRARVLAMAFAGVYQMYVQKAEAKGRTKAEVDEA